MKSLHICGFLILFFFLVSTGMTGTAYSSPGYDSETMDKKKKDDKKHEKKNENDDSHKQGQKNKKKEREMEKKRRDSGIYSPYSGKKPPKIYGPSDRTLRIDYKFHVFNLPSRIRTAYAWVPIPRATSYQTVIDHKVSGNWKYDIVKDRRYGNRYIRIDLTSKKPGKSPNAQVKVTYNVKRSTYQPIANYGGFSDHQGTGINRYLEPNRYVPVDGDLRHEAQRIIGGESGFQIQAKLLFDNIIATVRYDDSGLSTSTGDAHHTWRHRRGCSSDIHSMFIGEARSVAIPSRLVAGITVPIGSHGEISLYHTWAEFHDPGWGWLPVDIADAMNKPDYRDSYFGGLDANRIEFTIGRDIPMPGARGKPVNISFYPYVEVNGRVHDDVRTSISYKEKSAHGKKYGKYK